MELAPEQQIAPLLKTLRHKLLLWSSAKLSFAGRIMVVNSVLLATMWYILSCYVFSKSCINQIHRLEFLMGRACRELRSEGSLGGNYST